MSSTAQSIARAKSIAVAPEAEAAEQLLIQRSCQGDKKAFCLLVQPCEHILYLLASALTEDDEHAEELAQEAVLQAFLRLPEFKSDCRFVAWLMAITVAEARRRGVQLRPHVSSSLNGGEYWPRNVEPWCEIPSTAVEQPEFRRALLACLMSLPTGHCEVFVLRDVQKLTIAEIASVLAISQQEIERRLSGARLRVRDGIAASYVGTLNHKRSRKARAS